MQMVQHVDELFPVLLRVLSDSADEVVQQDLEVLAEIMSYPASGMMDAICCSFILKIEQLMCQIPLCSFVVTLTLQVLETPLLVSSEVLVQKIPTSQSS